MGAAVAPAAWMMAGRVEWQAGEANAGKRRPPTAIMERKKGYNQSMTLDEIRTMTAPVFQLHGVAYAAVFGSAARGEDKPESDVDILVRLGRRTGMVGYMRLIEDLESALHKNVDVVTEQSLNPHVRPYVAGDLATIYEG
jgi:uncharacterized protein